MAENTQKKQADQEKVEFRTSIVPKYLIGSEKEIEQDPILHTVLHVLMNRGRELLAVAAVIILFFSLITGYSAYRESQEKKASYLVAKAESLDDMNKKIAELKTVTDKYGSTHTGRQALLLLARFQEDAGQIDEARTTLKKAISHLSGLLKASAYLQLGYLEEAAKQPDKAKAAFEEASKEPAFAAIAQLDLARSAEAASDREVAKQAYRKYLELTSDNPVNKGFVEWRLSKL